MVRWFSLEYWKCLWSVPPAKAPSASTECQGPSSGCALMRQATAQGFITKGQQPIILQAQASFPHCYRDATNTQVRFFSLHSFPANFTISLASVFPAHCNHSLVFVCSGSWHPQSEGAQRRWKKGCIHWHHVKTLKAIMGIVWPPGFSPEALYSETQDAHTLWHLLPPNSTKAI